ncbi:uncharacterized protein LOC142178357 [Nicotiana tabacum]|uniref:Uncharacterized protein LOC142178357 n=1 Tax=Nicotiana tabacum TaxID=4097 RepID=A0AC58U2V0_TOBAC
MENNSGNGHTGYGATQPLGPNVDYTNIGYRGSTGSFVGAEKDEGLSMHMPMPFTPEQYDQILKMLQKDNTPEPTANAAGITGPLMLANAVSVTHSTDSKANDDKWIVDTGETDHMEILNLIKGLYPMCFASQVKGTGRLKEDLYYWPHSDRDRVQASAILCVTNEEELWHKRLGHIPHKTRFPFPQSTSRASKAFYLIHGDVWGPYKIPTYDENKFFLTLVDDYSRLVWIFLLKLKSDVPTVIKDFMTLVKTQFNSAIKVFRTDNGTEFFNSYCTDMFKNAGVVHQSSCAYKPQQNGVVERKHRHILEVARAIKFQGRIPLRFWGFCVQNAVYLINRIPSTALAGKSPFEMFYGRPPRLQHLRVLGSLCYVIVTDRSDKFGARAEPAEYTFPFKTTTSTCRRPNAEQFIDADDTFIIDPTSEVSEIALDSVIAPPPSPETSSSPNPTVPASETLQQPHLTSPPTTVMPHPTMAPLHDLPKEGLRKSTRTSKPPGWLNGFVHGMPKAGPSIALGSSYPMSAYMSYASLSPHYFKALCSFSVVTEPTSYVAALQDPKWIATMDAEL